MNSWLSDVKNHASEGVELTVVGHKCDLEHKREVGYEEGQALAAQVSAGFFETSAMDGRNINEMMFELAGRIRKKIKRAKTAASAH